LITESFLDCLVHSTMSTSTYGSNQIDIQTDASMTVLSEDRSLSDESFMMELFDIDFSDELSIPSSVVHSTDSDMLFGRYCGHVTFEYICLILGL